MYVTNKKKKKKIQQRCGGEIERLLKWSEKQDTAATKPKLTFGNQQRRNKKRKRKKKTKKTKKSGRLKRRDLTERHATHAQESVTKRIVPQWKWICSTARKAWVNFALPAISLQSDFHWWLGVECRKLCNTYRASTPNKGW